MKHFNYIANIILISLLIPIAGYAQSLTTAELLSGYLENDLSIQQLMIQLKQAQLENSITNISNGWSFNIESGTVNITTGSETSVTFSPSAELKIPQLNNLTLNIGSSIDIGQTSSNISNSSISLSADITSSTRLKKQITQLKSERTLLEAQRDLKQGFIESEQAFYKELNTLYKDAASLISSELSLYEDTISFEEIKAAGYKETSSKYRSAYLSLKTDEYNVEKNRHSLEKEIRLFAIQCGKEYTQDDPLAFLPTDIPDICPVDITSFDKQTYTKLESAQWSHYINQLSRKSNETLSVTANAGYTLDNKSTGSDTIDAGTTLKLNSTGLIIGAGISVPVLSESSSPVYKFNFSVDPNAFRTASLSKQQNILTDEMELINLQEAEKAYDDAVLSQQASLEDLQWSLESDTENYNFYVETEANYKKYLQSGLITETVYRQSFASMEKYRIQILIDKIQLILYNTTTKLLFTQDVEVEDEEK